ncbi:MAG: hypothetical protein EA353_00165, partial [Puniceicoccaceae bacterium]
QYQISLLNQADEKVPLENEGIVEKTYSLPAFEDNGTRNPSRTSFGNEILSFRPAEQLDSVNSEYSVEVSIQHIDVPSEPERVRRGNVLDTEPERFAHANGTVRFGEISTTITELQERPDANSASSGGTLPIQFSVPAGGGFINGNEDLAFGNATLPLQLNAAGVAVYTEAPVVTVARPTPDYTLREQGSFRFRHRQVNLSGSGANGSIEVFLPAGAALLGHDDDFDRPESLASPSQALEVPQFDEDVFPQAETLSFFYGSTTAYLSAEQFPLLYQLTQLTWNLGQDEITVSTSAVVSAQGHRYDYLIAPPGGVIPEPKAIIKRSNQSYLRNLDPSLNSSGITIRANRENGAAMVSMSSSLDLGTGNHQAHFPLGLELDWQSGQLAIEDSRIDVGNSSLNANNPVTQTYASGCPTAQCPTDAFEITTRLQVSTISFTEEGGLYASGQLVDAGGSPTAEILRWGRNDSGGFTHEALAFEAATFYSAGYVLAATHFPQNSEDAPAHLLLSGLDLDEPESLSAMERPGSAAYVDGLGDYPGFNFRVAGDGGGVGLSVLGGVVFEFGLTGRSKFYTRYGGVAGIHEAVEFNESKEIYGYPFRFSNFGLSFLAGENFDSRVNGEVDVVGPSDFTQEFENLTVTCTGGLDSAEPPEDDPTKGLAYWRSEFDTFAIQFEPDGDNPCDPTAGYLTLGIGTTPRAFALPLYGVVGFFNNGEIIALENDHLTDQTGAPAGVDSRLVAPSRLAIQGPAEESYSLEPVADIYFNSHALRDTENEEPFFSLAAGMGVPFFERLQAQIHFNTQSIREEDEEPNPGLYHVMGGWPTEGWRDEDDHFFSQASFDKANRGYPDEEIIDGYRNPTKDDDEHETYLVRARKEWLGVIPFDYPLRWNPVNRAFRSPR